jgi:hypothetical protein
MADSELKTRPTNEDVNAFIGTIDDAKKRDDSIAVMHMMEKLTGEKPRMWGPAIIGFGSEPLKYPSGKELDWPVLAFSPRKQYLTLYVLTGGEEKYKDLLDKLGKHTTGKVCLYLKKLSDVDQDVLVQLLKRSLER